MSQPSGYDIVLEPFGCRFEPCWAAPSRCGLRRCLELLGWLINQLGDPHYTWLNCVIMSPLLRIITLCVSIIMSLLRIITIISYYYVFETGQRADAGEASSTTGLAARCGLGDRGAGESACWSSKGRRRTARGGGIGGGGGGGRGGDGDRCRGHGLFAVPVAYNGDIVKELFLRSQLRFVLTRSCKPTSFYAANPGWRLLPTA